MFGGMLLRRCALCRANHGANLPTGLAYLAQHEVVVVMVVECESHLFLSVLLAVLLKAHRQEVSIHGGLRALFDSL